MKRGEGFFFLKFLMMDLLKPYFHIEITGIEMVAKLPKGKEKAATKVTVVMSRRKTLIRQKQDQTSKINR